MMSVQLLLLGVVFTICFTSVVSIDTGCNLLTFGQSMGFRDVLQCAAQEAVEKESYGYCCYGITRKPYCCTQPQALFNIGMWIIAVILIICGIFKICGCCDSKKDRNARIIVVQRQP